MKRVQLTQLLDDAEEHIRAWAIQLLCEDMSPPHGAMTKFVELALNDPSPVVRLYLASALQSIAPHPLLAADRHVARNAIGFPGCSNTHHA